MSLKKKIILLVINLFIFISTLVITILGVIFGASNGQPGDKIIGISYFKPFTIDSNVLMGICALVLCIYLIKNIIKKDNNELNKNVTIFYYLGVVSVSLTFITVVVFLTPTIWAKSGKDVAFTLYKNDMFFFHVLNPILSFISFILLDQSKKMNYKDNIIGVIPMFIYSIVYIINVVFTKSWNDFYGFTFGGKYYLIPIVLIVMYGATYLIGLGIRKIGIEKVNKLLD